MSGREEKPSGSHLGEAAVVEQSARMEFLWHLLMAIGILAGTGLSQQCDPVPCGHNLARRCLATQSSTHKEYGLEKAGPGNAVDGKRDGILDHGSCTHTQDESDPWWNVDLGSRYPVSTVIVKNREDCCGERLEGAQIHVGDSKGGQGKQDPICGTITNTTLGSVSTIPCEGLEGRYVTIVIPGRRGILTLCEVEVVAQGCPRSPVGHNLARRCPATQSSNYNQYEPERVRAENAVDGKRDGILDHGSCTHTQDESDPWWNVDLGSRYPVSTVIVKNREDCCGERLEGAQIHVGDSKGGQGKQDPICGTITDTALGSLSTISCDGRKGRYVTITIPGSGKFLTLCEVEVYGTQVWDDCN